MKKNLQGTVTLPLETYNAMFSEITRLQNAFKINKHWINEVEVELDTNAVWDIITEKFKNSEFANEYALRDVSNIYTASVIIAERIPTEETEQE